MADTEPATEEDLSMGSGRNCSGNLCRRPQVAGREVRTGERSGSQPPQDRLFSFKAAAIPANAFWFFGLVQLHLPECPQLCPFGPVS